MGKPAARVGDMTGHGSPLAPGLGSTKVLIGGKPAWRVGLDSHTCPLTTPVSHGAGKVLKGSLKVRIEGVPAVRQGDTIVEVAGPPNMVAEGSTKVLIGD